MHMVFEFDGVKKVSAVCVLLNECVYARSKRACVCVGGREGEER